MKKNFLQVLVVFILSFCIGCLAADAQTNRTRTPGQFPTVVPDNQNEVTGEANKSKEKSNDPNYDSKGKGGFMADFVRWYNENAPFKPTPVPLQNPTSSGHGPSFQDAVDEYGSTGAVPAAVNRNYYFSFGAGLGIAGRGGKFAFTGGTAKENILYVQIPVLARFSYMLREGGTLFAQAGLYYGIAVSGSYKDNTGKTKFKFGNSTDDDYRRGDYGLKFGAGYKLRSMPVFIALAADLGLRNMTPGGDKEVKIKNQSLGVQVGYVF